MLVLVAGDHIAVAAIMERPATVQLKGVVVVRMRIACDLPLEGETLEGPGPHHVDHQGHVLHPRDELLHGLRLLPLGVEADIDLAAHRLAD